MVKFNENFEFPVLRFVIFFVVLSVIALFVVYIYMLIMIFYFADVLELCVSDATNKLTDSVAKPYSALIP